MEQTQPNHTLPNHIKINIIFKNGIPLSNTRSVIAESLISYNTRTNFEMLVSQIALQLETVILTKPGFSWDYRIFIKPAKNTPQKSYVQLVKLVNFPILLSTIYERARLYTGFVPDDYIFDLYCYLTKAVVPGIQRATGARIEEQVRYVAENNPEFGVAGHIGHLQRNYIAINRARETIPADVIVPRANNTMIQLDDLDQRRAEIPPENANPYFVDVTVRMNGVNQIIGLDVHTLRQAINLPTLLQNIVGLEQVEGQAPILQQQDDQHNQSGEED